MLFATTAAAGGPPAGVDPETWNDIQTQIDADRYRTTQSDLPGQLYRADNPTQRFTAHFGAEEMVLTPRGQGETDWQLALRLTAWGQVAKIIASDGANHDDFSRSVSVDAGNAFIGAPYDDDAGEYSGSVYVFTISDSFFADGFETGVTSGWSVTVP